MVRCAQCDLVYAPTALPTADLYEDAYSREGVYNDYLEAATVDEAQVHVDWAMRQFLRRVPPGGRVLDVGCSTGKFMLAAKHAGWDPVGLDVSARAASIAARMVGVQTIAGMIGDVPASEQFDAVTAWETLEHVPDPVGFVDDARRLLKSGGTFAISVPNWSSPWMRKSPNVEHWPPYHVTFWEPRRLASLLDEAGFQRISIVEKPIAWEEEVGRKKWLYLPVAAFRSLILHQRGMHIFGMGIKA